jgi:hypothetical protein
VPHLVAAFEHAAATHERSAGTHDRAAAFFAAHGRLDAAARELESAHGDREGAANDRERARQRRALLQLGAGAPPPTRRAAGSIETRASTRPGHSRSSRSDHKRLAVEGRRALPPAHGGAATGSAWSGAARGEQVGRPAVVCGSGHADRFGLQDSGGAGTRAASDVTAGRSAGRALEVPIGQGASRGLLDGYDMPSGVSHDWSSMSDAASSAAPVSSAADGDLLTSGAVNDRSGQRSRLAALYVRVAGTLERSALLAEEHAERERRNGRRDSAGVELERARRAREAARRGRELASRLK